MSTPVGSYDYGFWTLVMYPVLLWMYAQLVWREE